MSLLSNITIGAGGRLVRVSDSDPAMLRYPAEQGIAIGHHCHHRPPAIRRICHVTVRVDDADHILGRRLARAMRVELDDG